MTALPETSPPAATSTALAITPATAVANLQRALEGAFVERRAEIRGLLAALVAGEHVLLLGPPGTAKSALAEALCKAIATKADFFQVLMTRYTVPEEVFGPVSLMGLERDEYKRVTAGYLPACKVGFLDEVFKANSSILNALLTILNEGEFDNGGSRQSIPLAMAIAASNELPADDSLHALYDRFVVRFWVDPIKDRGALRRLLLSTGQPSVSAVLSPSDLAALRNAAQAVTVPDDVADAILDLRDDLARNAGINASDRRWRKVMKLVRASAAIDGRTTADARDMMILASALWRTPDERAVVGQSVAKHAAPKLGEAVKLYDAAMEMFGKIEPVLGTAEMTAKMAEIANGNKEIQKIARQIETLAKEEPLATEYAEKVRAMQQSVARAFAKELKLT